MDVRKRALAALVGLPVALFMVALAGSPAGAADEGSVLQGTWTINVTVVEDTPNFGTENTTWTYRFGDGCVVGTACTVGSEMDGVEPKDTKLKVSDQGFTFTDHQVLDCYDTVTGAVSTPNGAVYDAEGQLSPATKEDRDGVSYITSMTGTFVETIEITAAGRADNCSIDGAGLMRQTQTAILAGAPVPLPETPTGTSPDPVGVDPGSTNTSGTLDEFTLPRSQYAVASALAVADERRSSVPAALVTPSDALDSVADRWQQDLLLLAALTLLIVFPAQIFNSTYEENHERIHRAFGRFRRRSAAAPAVAVVASGEPAPLEATPDGPAEARADAPAVAAPGRGRRLGVFLLCVLAGTVLGGLLDPNVGTNRPTVALLSGVFAALIVAVLVAAVAGWTFRSTRHLPHSWYLRAIPSALLMAALGVVVSRLTHFLPGYLYGVLGGAVFVGVLERRREGRVETFTLAAGLVTALVAWMIFEPVGRAANETDASLGVLVADAVLACLFIGGIEGLLFSLIPLKFLPGSRVRQWGWVPWGLLTLVPAYLFVHVLLAPETGYLGRSTTVSVTVTVALFIAFGLASCLFWLWFRLRPDPVDKPGPTDQPTGQDSSIGFGGPMDGHVAVPT